LENGWVTNEQSELLFWIPPNNRINFTMESHLLMTIGCLGTNIDLQKFVYGLCWAQCCK